MGMSRGRIPVRQAGRQAGSSFFNAFIFAGLGWAGLGWFGVGAGRCSQELAGADPPGLCQRSLAHPPDPEVQELSDRKATWPVRARVAG